MELTINQLLEQGIAAHEEGKLEEAEHLYHEVLKVKPDHIDANHNLGVIMYSLGKLSEAEVKFKKTIEFKFDYTLAHYNLGLVSQLLRKMDEAEQSFRKTIELKPDFFEAYNTLGIILKDTNRVEEAEEFFKKVLEIKPDFIKAHNNLSIMLKDLGRIDEAKASLRKSLIMESDFINLKNIINKGDWKKSITLFESICLKKVIVMQEYVKEFIQLWCAYCYRLLSENDLKNFITIFVKLLIISERNQDFNNLIKFFFDSVNINTVLKLVESKDKLLINLSYCQYKFLKEDFSLSEILVNSNIQDTIALVKNIETEDLAWHIVRRCLSMCRNKKFARKTLNDFIVNLELIK